MSGKIVSLLLALLMMLGVTCVSAEDAPLTVVDMLGREVVFETPANRIIALSPADCEIVCALGCGDMLIGRGEYCDYPESILELPSLGTCENLNVEEVLAMEPGVVFMSDMNQDDEQIAVLEKNGVKVVLSDTTDIEGVYTSIRLIGSVLGKDAEAEAVVSDMQATFDAIADLCEESEKTIYFEVSPLEWGLWTAGENTFMHELAGICGMQNAFGDIDGWQAISEEQVIERDPDYIVLVTGMGETAADEVMGRNGWGDVSAVANAAVYNADSYAMTRPGPRLKEAAIGLYEFLYGAEFAAQ